MTDSYDYLCLLLEHLPKENFELVRAFHPEMPKIGAKIYLYDKDGKKRARVLKEEVEFKDLPPKSPLIKALNEYDHIWNNHDTDLYENGGYETLNTPNDITTISSLNHLEEFLSFDHHSNRMMRWVDPVSFMPQLCFIDKILWEKRIVFYLAKYTIEFAQDIKDQGYDETKYPSITKFNKMLEDANG